MVMNAVMLFQSLVRCVPFAEIIPHMLHVVRSSEPGMRESLLLQLAGLTRIVKVHLHVSPRIFDLVCDYWNDHTEQVLVLVEEMAVSVREKFRPFVPRLMPLLLKSLVLPTTVSASSRARASQQTAGAGAVSAAGGSGAPLGRPPRRTRRRSSSCFDLSLSCSPCCAITHLVVPALIKLVDQMNELGPASRVAGLAEWQLKLSPSRRSVTTALWFTPWVCCESLARWFDC